MTFQYRNRKYTFVRYPKTHDRSLRAWSAADEHLVKYLDEEGIDPVAAAIYNDRFGFLACVLHQQASLSVINYASQEKALLTNAKNNNIHIDQKNFVTPLQSLPSNISLALVKIPKSLDLFRLNLHQIHHALDQNGLVLCGFMTRHFSAKYLDMASEFFQSVEQSLAWKKSRLLILRDKKYIDELNPIHSIDFNGATFRQYFGVFSAHNIDYASQFLIDHLDVNDNEKCVLDLASGNGVLAHAVQQHSATCDIHVLDDSYLAVESSRLNLSGDNIHFHYSDNVHHFRDDFFDLIVCNPPFHFEFENTIDAALSLFKGAKRCLKPGGRMLVVANQHLNYKTHLTKIFQNTVMKSENKKFVIYECSKANTRLG